MRRRVQKRLGLTEIDQDLAEQASMFKLTSVYVVEGEDIGESVTLRERGTAAMIRVSRSFFDSVFTYVDGGDK